MQQHANSLHDGYIALLIAILYHQEITADQAYKLLYNKTGLKKSTVIIPIDTIAKLSQVIESPNFKRTNKSWARYEQRLGISRYTICQIIKEYRTGRLKGEYVNVRRKIGQDGP